MLNCLFKLFESKGAFRVFYGGLDRDLGTWRVGSRGFIGPEGHVTIGYPRACDTYEVMMKSKGSVERVRNLSTKDRWVLVSTETNRSLWEASRVTAQKKKTGRV